MGFLSAVVSILMSLSCLLVTAAAPAKDSNLDSSSCHCVSLSFPSAHPDIKMWMQVVYWGSDLGKPWEGSREARKDVLGTLGVLVLTSDQVLMALDWPLECF